MRIRDGKFGSGINIPDSQHGVPVNKVTRNKKEFQDFLLYFLLYSLSLAEREWGVTITTSGQIL
jgi:hypothetical protein